LRLQVRLWKCRRAEHRRGCGTAYIADGAGEHRSLVSRSADEIALLGVEMNLNAFSCYSKEIP
jgi:hypothetical protein